MSSEPKPSIPYGFQKISEADIAAVVEVLHSPFLTQGPAVPAFEKALAANVSARYGVAVNSDTSALHIACLALGLESGDRLWTSPITFVASAHKAASICHHNSSLCFRLFSLFLPIFLSRSKSIKLI